MRNRSWINLLLLIFLLCNTIIFSSRANSRVIILGQDDTIYVLAIPADDYGEFDENEFNLNYQQYGKSRIIIDSETAHVGNITPELLRASHADVLYLHNLRVEFLSIDEQYAIASYVANGHGIIGTHETLNPNHFELATIFGLNLDMVSNGGMGAFPTSANMIIDDSSHPLFANMSVSYDLDRTISAAIDGQPSQWFDDPRILSESGNLLAVSTDGDVAIVTSEQETSRSVYFTHNPGVSASVDDLKLLYNSFIWTASNNEFVGSDYQFMTFYALIDGVDELVIDYDGISYIHHDAQLPGLFDEENVSTIINGSEWYPRWENIFSDEPQDSAVLDDLPIFPLLDVNAVNVMYSINNLSIISYSTDGGQRPFSNIYFSSLPNPIDRTPLSIMIEDNQPGAAWYAFSIGYNHNIPILDVSEPSNDVITTSNVITTNNVITSAVTVSQQQTITETQRLIDSRNFRVVLSIILLAIIGIGIFTSFQKSKFDQKSIPQLKQPPVDKMNLGTSNLTDDLSEDIGSKVVDQFCGFCGSRTDYSVKYCMKCGEEL